AVVGIEEIIGTTNADSTLIGADNPNNWEITNLNEGTINGVNFTAFNNLIGGNVEDTFALNGGQVNSIDGGVGNNTIIGDDLPNTWNLTGADAGNVNGANNFTGIQNLTGGNLDDNFLFADDSNFNGSISDNGGNDTFNFSAYNNPLTVDINILGAVGIENITGTINADSTLIGANNPNSWEITANNEGTINGVNFTAFGNLVGGTSTDTFTLNGGQVNSINGGVGDNTIVGGDIVNTWNLTGADAGNVNGANNFTEIQNLIGGSANDSFVFADGVDFDGRISGNEGNDRLDFSTHTNGRLSVDLRTLGAEGIEEIIGATDAPDAPESLLIGANNENIWEITGINSGTIDDTIEFTNFNSISGGSLEDTFILNGGQVDNIEGGGGNNTIVGGDIPNTWNIIDVDAGNVNGANNFTEIQNLIGGSANDSFVFADDVNFNGNINGNGGTDNLDFSAYTGPLSVDLNNLRAVGIEEIIGTTNALESLLIGANNPNIWEITGINEGTVDGINFTNFNSLRGGFSEDTFILNGGTVDSIRGNAGTNTLVGDDLPSTWNLTGGNAGNLNGANDFTEIQNLIGGSNNDSFVFADGVSFNGNINDNGGTDNFDFSLYTDPLTVNLNTLGAVGIEEIIGTINAESTLIGADNPNDWQITAANAGTINGVNFTDFNNLIGGTSTDTFTLNGGNVDSIDGAGGTNTIVGDNIASTWNLTGGNAGNLNGA
ncbi:MAG: hypothetical protein F6K47_22750, partial [Symploca sp. SIO2E6]|nr:hypothetical protein [Symploca sp. SIO2E6]